MSKKSNYLQQFNGLLSDVGIEYYYNNGLDIYTEDHEEEKFSLKDQLHTCSIDLRFRRSYKKIKIKDGEVLSYDRIKEHNYTTPYELKKGEKLLINPGEVILTTTLEVVHLSEEFAAIITGRSSISRLGIMVHCCQEFIHPGHAQTIPLQIINLSSYPVELDVSTPICQIVFFKLEIPTRQKYNDRQDAKYKGEINPTDSKIYEDLEKTKNVATDHNKSTKNGNRGSTSYYINKYFMPFLPSIIMLLVVTPFFKNNVFGKSFGDIIQSFSDMPVTIPIAIVLIILYIFAKKREKKWKYI